MWMLFVLVFLVVLSGPVALVLALMTRRELRRLRTGTGHGPATAIPRHPPGDAPSSAPPETRAPSPVGRDLEALVGGQWLTWIGVIAIFFGTAFFLAYDLGRSPLAGPGQLAIGVAVAGAFLGIGAALRQSRQRFLGLGLVGGGVALLFLAAYAGYAFHEMVDARTTYALLIGVSAVGAILALRLDSRTVTGLTLIGALLTPLFVSETAHDPEAIILFPYLVVVAAGANAVALRRGWPEISVGALAGAALQVAVWFEANPAADERSLAMAGGFALWLIFAMPPLFWPSAARGRGWFQSAILLGAGLAFLGFLHAWMATTRPELRGTVAAVLALAHLGMAALPLRDAWEPRHMAGYTAAILAALAIPMQFDLAAVSLGWGFFGLGLFYAGIRLMRPGYRWIAVGLLAADLAHAIFIDGIETLEGHTTIHGIFNPHFLASLGLAACCGAVAFLMRRHHAALGTTEARLRTPFILVAAGLGFLALTFENFGYFAYRGREVAGERSLRLAENLSLSVIWAVYAALLIAGGFWRRFRPIRMLGFLLLGITLVKVFGIDMQDLERGYRVASFVVVGALLLGLSILYQRSRRDADPR